VKQQVVYESWLKFPSGNRSVNVQHCNNDFNLKPKPTLALTAAADRAAAAAVATLPFSLSSSLFTISLPFPESSFFSSPSAAFSPSFVLSSCNNNKKLDWFYNNDIEKFTLCIMKQS
jgi:hypothetical protein